MKRMMDFAPMRWYCRGVRRLEPTAKILCPCFALKQACLPSTDTFPSISFLRRAYSRLLVTSSMLRDDRAGPECITRDDWFALRIEQAQNARYAANDDDGGRLIGQECTDG